MRVFAVLLFTLVTVSSMSCQNYMEPTESRRTVGEFTDDIAIHMWVKNKLLQAPEISGLRVNVEVDKGVVTLLGNVKTKEARALAGSLAREVPGVQRVNNQLVVYP